MWILDTKRQELEMTVTMNKTDQYAPILLLVVGYFVSFNIIAD